jgi:hypothetical protein
MPDTQIASIWDLRKPGERENFVKAGAAFVKEQKSQDFTCRAFAEGCECNMAQARTALNAMIAEGALEYEGTTRDMVYRKAKKQK